MGDPEQWPAPGQGAPRPRRGLQAPRLPSWPRRSRPASASGGGVRIDTEAEVIIVDIDTPRTDTEDHPAAGDDSSSPDAPMEVGAEDGSATGP